MVDSGATHNFIQSRVAHFLNLFLEPTPSPLRVMVGNGNFLPCTSFCPQAQVTIASFLFPVDLYPLDLSGTNLILGVEWLSQISPFIMRFMWENKMVELKGKQSPNPSPITAHQLRRLQQTNRVEALFQLTLEPLPKPITSSSFSTTASSTADIPTSTIS